MPHPLDAAAVRTWCATALDALGRARETIDAINVYPVADADTGTNLYLTVESAAQAVEAAWVGVPTTAEAVNAMAHGALIGAHGNSGTILAQLLRGMAQVTGEGGDLSLALRQAAESAREAVAHPVAGTILTVAQGAADAAGEAVAHNGTCDADIATAAYEGARAALEATPGQLGALAKAGVVDAGGYGLVVVLGALVEALTGQRPRSSGTPRTHTTDTGPACPTTAPTRIPASHGTDGGPAYEVVFLLDAEESAVGPLRERLDALGDSLVIVGGDGLWNVHVHVDDAGAAVEAGVSAGRPHRIRITHFDGQPAAAPPPQRAVVALVEGDGLAALCTEAGATVVPVSSDEPLASGELAAAVGRAHAREVIMLPGSVELRHTAAAAAERARAEGIRVAIIPTRSAVQGLAALAVHEPERRFDEDVVAMTSAAGATRFGELTFAERESWTTAGVCQAGDVLGLIDGDVAVIGDGLRQTATTVLDRMLAAGGELVTLVLGADAPRELARHLEEHVRRGYLGADTVVYPGRQQAPLLIGVE